MKGWINVCRKLYQFCVLVSVCVLLGVSGIVAADAAKITNLNVNPNDPFSKALQQETASKDKKPKVLTEEQILDLTRDYETQLKRKQFEEALKVLEQIPERSYTPDMKQDKTKLLMFKTIEIEVAQTAATFGKEDELDDYVKQAIGRLYKEAQSAYLDDNPAVVKDLLVHIIYLHRRNTRAKKFLENAFGLKTGSYKVENMEDKYWKRSETAFYGGNYEQAVESLQILTYFDRENRLIYERLGSAYYMQAKRKEAIEAWKTAVFLSGGKNKDLDLIITKTQKLIDEDEKKMVALQKEREERRKKTSATRGEMKLMSVFPTETAAYNFAADLKKNGLEAVVEELDNGKFAVKVPVTKSEEKSEAPTSTGNAVQSE